MQHFIHVTAAQLIEKILEIWMEEREHPTKHKDSESFIKKALSEIVQKEGFKLIKLTKSKKGDYYICEVDKNDPLLKKETNQPPQSWLDHEFVDFMEEIDKEGVGTVRLWDFLKANKSTFLEINKNISVKEVLEYLKKEKVHKYSRKTERELFDVLMRYFAIKEKELAKYKVFK